MLKELRAKAIVMGLFVASLPLLVLLKAWERVTRKARETELGDADDALKGHPLTWPPLATFKGQPLPAERIVVDDPALASRPLTPEARAEVRRWWETTMDKRLGGFDVLPARTHQEDQPGPELARQGGAGGGLTDVNPFTAAAVKVEPSASPAIGFSMEPLGPELARMPLEHHAQQHRARTAARGIPWCKCKEPRPLPGVDGFGYCGHCDLALPSNVPQPEMQKRYINSAVCTCPEPQPVDAEDGFRYCKRCEDML